MLPSLTIGVDVSKKVLECHLFDCATREDGWHKKYDNSAEGIMLLMRESPRLAVFILEPTGRYGNLLVEYAHKHDRRVRLAPNRQAKHYLKSCNPRGKNDPMDSRGLARFGAVQELLTYTLKSEPVERLDQYLSLRKQISKSISRLRLQAKTLSYVRDTIAPIILSLKRELDAIDKKIAEISKTDATFAPSKDLLKVPGIGPVTAAAVTSRLVSKNFISADSFVAYVGLDITVNDSGDKKGRGRLSKQGDAELRRLLYCCAQASLRSKDPTFKAQYDREIAKGLATTKALCAVARKMAKLCWSIVHYGTKYDPGRVYQQPKP
jgi:transposase